MALSLDLSLSDRFDEDYRQERQGAEDADMERWWAQQVVPQGQPGATPGQGPATPPGGATSTTPTTPPGTGVIPPQGEVPGQPKPPGYPLTSTSAVRAEAPTAEAPEPVAAVVPEAEPSSSYVRQKIDQIAKETGLSDPGLTEALWTHLENKPARVALQAVDWFFKIGNVIPSVARAVLAPKETDVGAKYAEWVNELPEAVKPLVPGAYDPDLAGNVQGAYNTAGTMVEVLASLQGGSDLIDYIPGLITKLGGKADEAMAILKSEEGAIGLPGGTPKPPDAEMTSRAIELFGVTDDPVKAGYVLPDGRMLDLAQRQSATGHASQEHRDVYRLFGGDVSRLDDDAMIRQFAEETGAVRWGMSPGSGELMVDMHAPITDVQHQAILRGAAKAGRVSIRKPDGADALFVMPTDRAGLRAFLNETPHVGPSTPGTLPGGPTTPPEAQAAEALLTGAPDAPRLNMAQIDATARTKRVMAAVNRLNVESGETEAAVRGVVGHAETQTAATQLLREGTLNVETLLDMPDGTFLAGITPEIQALAARQIRVSSGKSLEDIASRAKMGDMQAADDIYDALALHGAIDLKVTAMSASAGRTLDIHNVAATAERGVNLQGLADIADRLKGAPMTPIPTAGLPADLLMILAQAGKTGPSVSPTDLLNVVTAARTAGTMQGELSPDILMLLAKAAHPVPEVNPVRVAEMIQTAQALGGRNAVDTMASQTVKHPYANAVLEAWINGLLSGPQTHAANALSNSITTFWAVPERMLAARLHPGTDIGVMKGEGTQLLYGMVNGFSDGLRLAAKSFASGVPESGLQKMDFSPAITADALGASGLIGRGVDMLGKAVRLPGRFLMASDEFFKAINYRMELHAQAFRQASMEGLDGDAMARRIGQIVADPPASIKTQAEGFAAYQTFTQELGETGQAFLKAANSHPAIRVVVPFIRTPTNIFKYAMERTPILNMASNTWKSDMKAGGVRADLALAKMSLGGAVMSTTMALAAGGVITGGGPSDPHLKKMLRDTGWQPYSLKVGQDYYSYNRLDPIGMILGLSANIAEISGELPNADLDQLAMASVLATMESLTSKTYLQGLSKTLEAIQSPDRGGVDYLRGLARSAIPAGIGQFNRAWIDPQMREVNGLLDEMRARVPGFSDDLPPRRNLFGDPVILEGGLGPDLISPIYTTSVKDDPVSAEIVKQRISLAMPSKGIGGAPASSSPMVEDRPSKPVALTPPEYDLLVRLAGNELKDPKTGFGMKEALAAEMKKEVYKQESDGPEGGKAFRIKKIVQTYREAAQLEIQRRSPNLKELVDERTKAREQALKPPASAGIGIMR